MSRAINAVEAVPYRKIVGRDALAIRVAHTAASPKDHLATSLAVYVNRANPLAQLTAAQVSQILSAGNPDGDFTRWGQLGLQGEWRERVIHPSGTAAYTGFGDYLQRAHFQGRALALRHEELGNTEAITARIAQDPAGIGVATLGWVNAAAISDQVRVLPLAARNGDPYYCPDKATVQACRYPLAMPVQLYVNRAPGRPLDPLVKAYLQLALSLQGQAVIALQQDSDEGYLPLGEGDLQAERNKLDAL